MSVMAMDSTFKGDHVLMHLYLCLEMAMKTGVSCLCRGEGLSVRYEGHAKRYRFRRQKYHGGTQKAELST